MQDFVRVHTETVDIKDVLDVIAWNSRISGSRNCVMDRATAVSLLAEKKEDLISSPEKMYMLSLVSRERLPEELHNAMLLWSFDSNMGPYVQMYLEWSSHCDEMKSSRIRFEKSMLLYDRIMLGSILLTGVILGFVIVVDLLK